MAVHYYIYSSSIDREKRSLLTNVDFACVQDKLVLRWRKVTLLSVFGEFSTCTCSALDVPLSSSFVSAVFLCSIFFSACTGAGQHWQTYGVPVRERGKRPMKFQTKLFEDRLTFAQEAQNYKRLCRGEQLRTPKMDSHLRCRYYHGRDGFFRLQPVKIEEANLKPYIIVFHDIIGDRDIEDLLAFATPRLLRSTHYGAHGMETSLIRTSSNAWLGDLDAPVASRLNRFLHLLLGLGTRFLNGEAEHYQLANYGVGGQYVAHHDFLADIYNDPNRKIDDFERTSGDRIATLMFYLSDVEEGGATVFPQLGVRLTPKKGNAAFWWNLNSDGEGEVLTKHGGCPVLYGSKWIANKWFRSHSNIFRLPCSLNRSDSLGPLV